MNQELDINIELRFVKSDAFPAYFIYRMIDIIDSSIYVSEILEIDNIAMEFKKEFPPIVVDAAKYRAQAYRGKALRIESASPGSVVLFGAVAGLSVWILQSTLGETLKQAWVETDMHRKLKNFLLSRKNKRVDEITYNIKRYLEYNQHDIGRETSVTFDVVYSEDGTKIIIIVNPTSQLQQIPKTSELFKEDE